MATIPLLPDFRDLLRFFSDEEVQYLIVGGMAVNLYGYHRATGDMDVWVAVTTENEDRLANALERFGFSKEAVAQRPLLEKPKFIRIGEKPIRVEILTEISGVEFEHAFGRRNVVAIEGLEINFIRLDDLRTNKSAAGRTKDVADLEHLPDSQ
jgi:predicted nucleotidyltransferase